MAPYLSMKDRGHALVAHSLRTRGPSPHAATLLSPGPPIAPVCRAGGHRRRRDLRRRHRDAARYRRSPCSMSPSCCWRWTSRAQSGILIVAAGCAALTVLSYAITHDHDPASGPFLRCLISLVAIGITAPSPRATRARSRRCASMQACSTSRTTRSSCATTTTSSPTGTARRPSSTAGGANRRSGARQPSCCRPSSPRRSTTIMAELAAPDAGRANWCIPRATARRLDVASRWALQRDGRGRPAAILETNNDITERARSRTACTRAQQRARPCRARRHPGRAHRLDRP